MITQEQILAGLGRPEREIDIAEPLERLTLARVLVTGASGAIGGPLTAVLREAGIRVVPTDIYIDSDSPWGTSYMDVTNFRSVMETVAFHEPALIVNFAARKLVVEGEANPWPSLNVNTLGLKNLLDQGRPVLHGSSCKAADPICFCGHTRALAERLTLNAGSSVLRFFNVFEAGPSVLDTWDEIPEDQPLPVTDCGRYGITIPEAVALTLWAMVLPPARYIVDPGERISMSDYAARVFPGREQVQMPLRRGDRLNEPLCGSTERIEPTRVPHIKQVINANDA